VADDLWTQAQTVLDAVAGHLAHPPTRRFVADGVPAFDDCEQLTIHLTAFTRGTPQATRPGMPCAPSTVDMVVTRTWCVPTSDDGAPPSLAALKVSGKAVVNEAHELWQAVSSAANEVSCRPSILGAAPVGPSGGYVGWTVTISWTP